VTTTAPAEGDLIATEARIAKQLSDLATGREIQGQHLAPPAYVRRHLAEHAHAGDVLNTQTLPDACLPYVDLARLRELGTPDTQALPLMPALRRAQHQWAWERPATNATYLQFWAAATGLQQPPPIPGQQWRPRWATRTDDRSEILVRHAGAVSAVATTMLPDETPIVVTASSDRTVRVWDLTTNTQIGGPLAGPLSRRVS
jgi:hypothetical protein